MFSDLFSLISFPLVLFFGCVTAGWMLGLLTGLLPGLHTNNVAAVLAGSASFLYAVGMSSVLISVIILSCAVSHTFHNIIPAVFLGAPGEETAMAVLPGHRLLLSGQGETAVRLSALGSIGAVLISPILMIPAAFFLERFYPILEPFMGWFLLILSLILLLSEKKPPAILRSAFVFLAAGLLGLVAFELDEYLMPFSSFSETSVLMPLLSGLFGVPYLILSFLTASEMPDIPPKKYSLSPSFLIRNAFLGTAAGAFVSWIPGVSSSSAAVLAGIFTGRLYPGETMKKSGDKQTLCLKPIGPADDGEQTAKEFIVSVSAINTANVLFGLLAFFMIGKSRNGAVVSVRGLLEGSGAETLSLDLFFVFYISLFLAGFLSYFSTATAGRYVPGFLRRIPSKHLSAVVLIFLSVLTFWMTGVVGFVLFFISVLIGFLPLLLGVRKSHLSGVILFPVMLFFGGFR